MAADRDRDAEGLRLGSRGVILDSNFLFVPLRFGVDIFSEVERLLGPSVVCLVPAAVLAELEVLRDGASPSLLREIDFALELAGRCRVLEGDRLAGESVDDLILRLAVGGGFLVATNDGELRGRLRGVGVAVVFLRQRAYLEVEGYVEGLG
jgi:rRNA-processing protein FCF1